MISRLRHDFIGHCIVSLIGKVVVKVKQVLSEVVIVNDENGKLIKVEAKDLLPFAWQSVIC